MYFTKDLFVPKQSCLFIILTFSISCPLVSSGLLSHWQSHLLIFVWCFSTIYLLFFRNSSFSDVSNHHEIVWNLNFITLWQRATVPSKCIWTSRKIKNKIWFWINCSLIDWLIFNANSAHNGFWFCENTFWQMSNYFSGGSYTFIYIYLGLSCTV